MSQGTLTNFIGGEWVASKSTQALAITNPATGELLGKVPLSTREDVDAAVAAARRAFASWRRTPPVERARVLFRFKNLLEQHKDELARICTLEHGKTVAE